MEIGKFQDHPATSSYGHHDRLDELDTGHSTEQSLLRESESDLFGRGIVSAQSTPYLGMYAFGFL